jgi:hypothetical protein
MYVHLLYEAITKLRYGEIRYWTLLTTYSLSLLSGKHLFTTLKAPYTFLRAMGLNPQMAATFLFAGSVATTGVVAAEVMEGRSFSRGDSGNYAASVVGGILDVPTSYEEGDNTLLDKPRLNTPVREITIENVSVGTVFTGSALPSGQQNVVDIGGNVVTGGTNTRLEVGHLIFENSRCKKLELDRC